MSKSAIPLFVAIAVAAVACEKQQPRDESAVDVGRDTRGHAEPDARGQTEPDAQIEIDDGPPTSASDVDDPDCWGEPGRPVDNLSFLTPHEGPGERLLSLSGLHGLLFVHEDGCWRELDYIRVQVSGPSPNPRPVRLAQAGDEVRILYDDGRVRLGLGDQARFVAPIETEGPLRFPWVLSDGGFAISFHGDTDQFHHFDGDRWSRVSLEGAGVGDEAIFVESSGPSELMAAGRKGVASYDTRSKRWSHELQVTHYPRTLKRDGKGRMFFIERGHAWMKEGGPWRSLVTEPSIGFDAVVAAEETWISGQLQGGEHHEGFGRVFYRVEDGQAVEHSRFEGDRYRGHYGASFPPAVFGENATIFTRGPKDRSLVGFAEPSYGWIYDGGKWSWKRIPRRGR